RLSPLLHIAATRHCRNDAQLPFRNYPQFTLADAYRTRYILFARSMFPYAFWESGENDQQTRRFHLVDRWYSSATGFRRRQNFIRRNAEHELLRRRLHAVGR